MEWKVRVNSVGGLLLDRRLKNTMNLRAGDDIEYEILEINNQRIKPIRASGNITKIGGSLMVVVNKKNRLRLGLRKGDVVTIKIRGVKER